MAITKYKVIQKNLEAVINYAKNGYKTEKGDTRMWHKLFARYSLFPNDAYKKDIS